MRMALQLAKRGRGRVAPNPLVGAVIVKEECVVARGWHRQYGDTHAELSALQRLDSARGLSLYCNLEPCADPWEGKVQPSCARKIVEAGIRRVVIAELDSHNRVRGKGVEILRSAGIDVQVGVLASEAHRLNEIYHHFLATERPFVHLKAAISLDGCLATGTGDSAWISDLPSRNAVHRMRSDYDGVLVGSGTLCRDDPQLTVRHVKGRNPHRFILCSDLSAVRHTHRIWHTEEARTTIFTTESASSSHLPAGVEIVCCPRDEEGISLTYVLEWMAQHNITSLLVEGGQKVFTSLVKQKLWDKITLYLAPLIIGGGISFLSDIGIQHISDAQRYRIHWSRSGEDRRITLYHNDTRNGNDV